MQQIKIKKCRTEKKQINRQKQNPQKVNNTKKAVDLSLAQSQSSTHSVQFIITFYPAVHYSHCCFIVVVSVVI